MVQVVPCNFGCAIWSPRQHYWQWQPCLRVRSHSRFLWPCDDRWKSEGHWRYTALRSYRLTSIHVLQDKAKEGKIPVQAVRTYVGEKRYLLLLLLCRFDSFLDHGLPKLIPSLRSSLLPPSSSENTGIASVVLNIATGWWMASFKPQQLYLGEERASGTQGIGGWVSPEPAGRWLVPTCLRDRMASHPRRRQHS